MIRGTTPTFELTIDADIDLTDMTNVYATFRQGKKQLTKTGSDIDVYAKKVDVYLEQSETLEFCEGVIQVQLNWTYDNGSRSCSEIAYVRVGDNLEERELE